MKVAPDLQNKTPRDVKTVGKPMVAHCTTNSGGGDVGLVDGFSKMVDGFPKKRERRGKTSLK